MGGPALATVVRAPDGHAGGRLAADRGVRRDEPAVHGPRELPPHVHQGRRAAGAGERGVRDPEGSPPRRVELSPEAELPTGLPEAGRRHEHRAVAQLHERRRPAAAGTEGAQRRSAAAGLAQQRVAPGVTGAADLQGPEPLAAAGGDAAAPRGHHLARREVQLRPCAVEPHARELQRTGARPGQAAVGALQHRHLGPARRRGPGRGRDPAEEPEGPRAIVEEERRALDRALPGPLTPGEPERAQLPGTPAVRAPRHQPWPGGAHAAVRAAARDHRQHHESLPGAAAGEGGGPQLAAAARRRRRGRRGGGRRRGDERDRESGRDVAEHVQPP